MNWDEWIDMKELTWMNGMNWHERIEMNELKGINWNKWIEMQELKWINYHELKWTHWNEFKRMAWTEWMTWLSWHEWIDMKKWKNIFFYVFVWSTPWRWCGWHMKSSSRYTVSCTFCRPHLQKVVRPRQFFFTSFMWNRTLSIQSRAHFVDLILKK